MTDLILWGGSGHAKVLRECASQNGFRLIALFDNNQLTSPFEDVPLYHGETGFLNWIKKSNNHSCIYGLAAIGGSRGRDRISIHRLFKEHGIRLPTLIHPRAFVAESSRLAQGVQVLAGATIAVDCSIQEASIINTSASIDHECRLGCGVHVGPGAVLTGCVEVGDCAFVGAGAVVLPRIRIGEDAIVGAGAVVTKDVAAGTTVCGCPARVINRRDEGR